MFILAPYTIDPAVDVLRNTAEPDELPAWSDTITYYGVGALVTTGAEPGIRIWRARYDRIQPNNPNAGLPTLLNGDAAANPSGHNRVGYDSSGALIVDPRAYPNVGDVWWEDVTSSAYYSNANLMFDPDPQYRTEAPYGIQFDLRPSEPWNAAVFFGLSGSWLNVQIVNGPAFNQTRQLYHADPISPDYPNEPTAAFQLPLVDPAQYPSAFLRVALFGRADAAQTMNVISSAIVGRALEIGRTIYGVEIELMDFSRYERDVFGHALVIRRGYSDRVTYPHVIEAGELTQARAIFTARRALPTVFIGSFEVPATICYGYFQDLEQTYDSMSYIDGSVVVESILFDAPAAMSVGDDVVFFDPTETECVEDVIGSSHSLCLTAGTITEQAACTFLTPALQEGDTVEWTMTWTTGSSTIEPTTDTPITTCEQTLSVLRWPPSVPVAHEPGTAEIVAVITHADESQTTLGTAYLTVGCANLGCTAAPLAPTWSDGSTTAVGYVRAPA